MQKDKFSPWESWWEETNSSCSYRVKLRVVTQIFSGLKLNLINGDGLNSISRLSMNKNLCLPQGNWIWFKFLKSLTLNSLLNSTRLKLNITYTGKIIYGVVISLWTRLYVRTPPAKFSLPWSNWLHPVFICRCCKRIRFIYGIVTYIWIC